MPFTLAHPSAVIFSKNKYLNLSGLVLGSMSPDFIYFLLFGPSSNVGHTLTGFIFINLPLCFLLNFLFYNYMQTCFILSLPNFLSKHYLYLKDQKNIIRDLKKCILFTYSCLLGMLTHVLWDAFTHKGGFFVQKIVFLRESVYLLGHDILVYKILQHGSTLIGFLILAIFFYTIRDKNPKTSNLSINKFTFFIFILLITIATLLCCYTISVNTQGIFSIGRFVVTFINGIFLGYLTMSIFYTHKYNL